MKLNEAVSISIARNKKNINVLFDRIANFFIRKRMTLELFLNSVKLTVLTIKFRLIYTEMFPISRLLELPIFATIQLSAPLKM